MVGLVTLLVLLPATWAQETVTIPKARYEELLRKEKEWDKLNGDLSAAKKETAQLKKEKDEAVAKVAAVKAAAPAEPIINHVSPAMNTLPALQKGETVNALDLANHYRADVSAADARYRKKVFKVQGEIVGFDKPLLTRNYHVLLQTTDRQMRLVCTVVPPEKFSAVFTTESGSHLVGTTSSGARTPLAKVGDTVVIEGRCGGLDKSVIEMNGCSLVSVR